jgi:hypothetical protein
MRAPPFAACRHCGRTVLLQARRLCNPCYKNPAIREQYAPGAKHVHQHQEQAEARADAQILATPRAAGDPPHRCLWCMAWRCQAPLRRCASCQAAYEELRIGMPEEEVPNYPLFQEKESDHVPDEADQERPRRQGGGPKPGRRGAGPPDPGGPHPGLPLAATPEL